MAELNHEVDENKLENSFEPIPAGVYLAVIDSADYVENKKGTGMILKLVYQIIDGPQKDKKIFENLNREFYAEYKNSLSSEERKRKEDAEGIAYRAINSIGVAVGLGTKIKDTAQLLNIPMKIEVTVKKSEEYGIQNNIRGHLPVNGEAKTAAKTEAKTEAAPAETKKPWEKKK